jgi:hypothetical protein
MANAMTQGNHWRRGWGKHYEIVATRARDGIRDPLTVLEERVRRRTRLLLIMAGAVETILVCSHLVLLSP